VGAVDRAAAVTLARFGDGLGHPCRDVDQLATARAVQLDSLDHDPIITYQGFRLLSCLVGVVYYALEDGAAIFLSPTPGKWTGGYKMVPSPKGVLASWSE
jgi:hypothetical protein